MKLFYPVIMGLGRLTGKKKIKEQRSVAPVSPFYMLQAELNDKSVLSFEKLRGKKVLIVNTASNCGFTAQYAELQQLYSAESGDLVVIGFPANDFKEQEKGNDEEIAKFCQANFGVTFPLARKTTVAKGPVQHPVFHWLSDKSGNGWNTQAPEWNFSKYLINEEGKLTHYFPPTVSPLSEEVLQAVRM